MSMMISLSALAIVTVAFVFGGAGITGWFIKNDNIERIGGLFLRGFGISLVFMCLDFTAVGVSQSFGMGKIALIFSFLRKAFLEIPLLFVYNHFWGLEGIAFCQCSAEIVMSFVAIFVLRKLIKDAENRPICKGNTLGAAHTDDSFSK